MEGHKLSLSPQDEPPEKVEEEREVLLLLEPREFLKRLFSLLQVAVCLLGWGEILLWAAEYFSWLDLVDFPRAGVC